MKKNIWIINHHATDMFSQKRGRHYNFAKNLKKKGYNPIVFCSNIEHSTGKIINTKNKSYIVKKDKYTKFVFVKISPYGKSLKKRFFTMLQFFFTMLNISNDFDKPDIIIGSSVHPLACVAGILLARKYHCDCISEIRDLWPESLVSFNIIKRNSLIYRIVLQLEKWIYKNSNKVIFTMPDGYQYIRDMKWQKQYSKNKFYYINNGIDIDKANGDKIKYNYRDIDFDNKNIIKFTYVGSVRKANNIDLFIETAMLLSNNKNIKILVVGKGPELNEYINKVRERKLSNIIFKGYIENKYLQSIYKKSNYLIWNYMKASSFKYGSSSNKLFEYLTSGRPILSTINFKNNIITKYNLGFCAKSQRPRDIYELMIKMSKLKKSECMRIANNQKEVIKQFDYKNLTKELIKIIES